MRTAEIKNAFDQATSKAASATGKAKASAEHEKAVIHNLYHDDRISPERARKFLTGCCAALDHESLLEGLKAYHSSYVRRWSDRKTREFAFHNAVDNQGNIFSTEALAGTNLGSVFNVTHWSLELPIGRVIQSTRIPKVAGASIDTRVEEIAARLASLGLPEKQEVAEALNVITPILDSAASYNEGITGALEGASDAARRFQIASSVLRLLSLHNSVDPFEPTWAFPWEELEKLTTAVSSERIPDLSPEAWCESVGICAIPNDWLVLLKYPADRPRLIVRPTQLDAGKNGYHFPSPVRSHQSGGHPVWLSHPPDEIGTHLIQEYIHQSVPFLLHDIVAVKQVLRMTPENEEEIVKWRLNHWSALQGVYENVPDWMRHPDKI